MLHGEVTKEGLSSLEVAGESEGSFLLRNSFLLRLSRLIAEGLFFLVQFPSGDPRAGSDLIPFESTQKEKWWPMVSFRLKALPLLASSLDSDRQRLPRGDKSVSSSEAIVQQFVELSHSQKVPHIVQAVCSVRLGACRPTDSDSLFNFLQTLNTNPSNP